MKMKIVFNKKIVFASVLIIALMIGLIYPSIKSVQAGILPVCPSGTVYMVYGPFFYYFGFYFWWGGEYVNEIILYTWDCVPVSGGGGIANDSTPDPGCTDNCSPDGKTKCSGTSRYKICGDYDSDPCLEWSGSKSCGTDRWVNIGSSYSCCDGDDSCTCRNQEFIDYYCSGGSCHSRVTNTRTRHSNCSSCDDGNWCTAGDGCAGGECNIPSSRGCSDTNSCTIDSCNEAQNRCDYNLICNGSTCALDSSDYCNSCSHCSDGDCNCGETGVTCPADCLDNPGVEGLQITSHDCCTNTKESCEIGFEWTYKSVSDILQQKFDFQVADNAGFGNPEVDRTIPSSGSLGYPDGRTNNQIVEVRDSVTLDKITFRGNSNEKYYWRVKVYDENGGDSGWVNAPSFFQTEPHAWPWSEFSWDPENPAVDEMVTFIDNSTCFSIGDPCDYEWDFDYTGNNSCSSALDVDSSDRGDTSTTYLSAGSHTIRLRITDNDLGPNAYCCQDSQNFKIKLPLPGWTETGSK